MILLWGIPSEPPLAMVYEELKRMAAPVIMFNQRQFENSDMELDLRDGQVGGTLRIEDTNYALSDIRSAYVRPMDDTQLPEIIALPSDDPERSRCRALNDLMLRWLDITPARIVNRPEPMGSNMSKPYQMHLIRQLGLDIPETLITNDPDEVIEFHNQWGRVIYKSISGVRSIVKELKKQDISRLDNIRLCPTQFQQYVEGFDVRVHTIGNKVFATRADTNVADYRYSPREQDGKTELSPYELSAELKQRCTNLATGLGLDFAGIDLKITPDGRAYCFEVNPCPAYSYYEMHTGQPIARAVAEYLDQAF